MERHPFDLIIQAVLEQEQLMERLADENWRLRRQLTDLQGARGIFVDIEGKRFALNSTPSQATAATIPSATTPTHHPSGTSDTTTATSVFPLTAPDPTEPVQNEEEENQNTASHTTPQEGRDRPLCEQPTIPMDQPLEKANFQEATNETDTAAL
jgi:hypothetical protein